MKTNLRLILPLLFCLRLAVAQPIYPSKHWKRFQKPDEAGWSVTYLDQAKRYSDSLGLAAVMIVYRGAVLASWGDTERKYLCHSIRKSFISALYGMTPMDLEANLGQLGIDDTLHPLQSNEKQATVRELLAARSGIFLPAAYEGNPDKPARGSHPHGTFWLYNNWDFNALGLILQKKTGRSFFEDLQQRLCTPLQMEDVDSLDIFYKYERERSAIPAYTFKMSTRDLARFGLLYVRNGQWRDKQVVPAAWVKESTTLISKSDDPALGYGYLWWTDEGPFNERGMYFAAGMGGHRLFIFPKDDLVVVIRTDTYTGQSADNKSEFKLLSTILAGKTGPALPTPSFTDLPPVSRESVPPYRPLLTPQNYVGTFQFAGEWMTIYPGKNGLLMDSQYMGKFYLDPFSPSLFRLRDQENYINFIFDRSGKAIKLIYHDKSIISISSH